MAGETEIVAKFIADTSGFESGAKQVEEDSMAIEKSTQQMSQSFDYLWTSFDKNGKVVQETMHATTQAAADQGKALNAIREQELGMAGGIADVGEASEKTAEKTKTLGDETEKTGEKTKKTTSGYHEFMGALQDVQNIIQMVQLLGQIISAMDKVDEAAKNTQTAFTNLMKSADDADAALKSLNTTAAAKDFGAQAVDNVAQKMLMMGKSAADAQKEISAVADTLAAMGKDGSQLEPVVTSLDKIKTESKVTTQEIDQLVQQGIPAWAMLADAMGTDIQHAQDRVKAGAVTGAQAFNDIMNQSAQYAQAADKQSESLGSEWARLGGHVSEWFKPVLDQLAKFLESINEIIEGTSRLNEILENMGQGFSSFGGSMGAIGHASGIIDSPVGHMAMVGEEGPELMYVPQGASIFPNGSSPFDGGMGASSASSSLAGGFGGGGSSSSGSSGGEMASSSSGTSYDDLVSAMEAAFTRALASVGGSGGSQEAAIYMDSLQVGRAVIPHFPAYIRQNFGMRR